ncbi:hypothetical protein AB0L85_25050 [Streptomyces sp. NPDC052051]|uniref:hypothetical protein n=1 Tax=Streptomyces sp. NPDC052051 TaxID=3154649 RepID=UPI0034261A25
MFGVWLRTNDADYIAYERYTSTAHQSHIIAHELSHMLCDHRGERSAESPPVELFADLDPGLVRGMLMRCGYTQEAEQEAEVMASLLLLSLNTRHQYAQPEQEPTHGHQEALARIEEAIGLGSLSGTTPGDADADGSRR